VQAGNPAVRQAVAEALVARHPSQLYQAGLEGVALFLVLLLAWTRPRPPWTIGGLFCVGYGVLRIVGEHYRLPDAHNADQEFAAWGVTRGQWLSVLVVAVGIGVLAWARDRTAESLGGWTGPTGGGAS
jgi:phosphatidylglycerol:prolipoprotein diacylglycerol transferase